MGIGGDFPDHRAGKIDIRAFEQAAGVGELDGEILRRLEDVLHLAEKEDQRADDPDAEKEKNAHRRFKVGIWFHNLIS
jgi:hypothetical protein